MTEELIGLSKALFECFASSDPQKQIDALNALTAEKEPRRVVNCGMSCQEIEE